MNRSFEPAAMPETLEQQDELLLNLGTSVEPS